MRYPSWRATIVEHDSLTYKNYTELSDAEHAHILERRNYYKKYSLQQDKAISMEEHLRYIDRLRTSHDKLYFALFQNNELFFSINFQNMDVPTKSATWGFFKLTQKPIDVYWVLNHILHYYFDTLHFETLYASVNLHNVKSVKIHDELGFKQQIQTNETISFTLSKKDFYAKKNLNSSCPS